MVRTVPKIPLQGLSFLPPSLAFVTMAIAVVSLLSAVAFLCGSERAKRFSRRRGEKAVRLGSDKTPVTRRLQSSLSSKTHLLVKMISWRKVQDDDGDEDEENMVKFDGCGDDDEEEAVWKKTIIKGEKCRPLNFSGKILYDSDGNLIPDSSHPQQSQ